MVVKMTLELGKEGYVVTGGMQGLFHGVKLV